MEDAGLRKLVDSSGFLFQLAVEQHIRDSAKQDSWTVLTSEYPWQSVTGERAGFIDLIVDRNGLRIVLECKRSQGAEWIFLIPPDPDNEKTPRLRTLWSFKGRDQRQGWGWDDLPFDPESFRASFCVVRGHSDQDRPMLERIAGDIARASESLAREELAMPARGVGPSAYIPVVVTNAKLYACRVRPSEVDLGTGYLPDNAGFEEIPWVRFRKALPSDLSHPPESYSSLAEGLRLKERSAFVVNVLSLAEWLGQLRERSRPYGRSPWGQFG